MVLEPLSVLLLSRGDRSNAWPNFEGSLAADKMTGFVLYNSFISSHFVGFPAQMLKAPVENPGSAREEQKQRPQQSPAQDRTCRLLVFFSLLGCGLL